MDLVPNPIYPVNLGRLVKKDFEYNVEKNSGQYFFVFLQYFQSLHIQLSSIEPLNGQL